MEEAVGAQWLKKFKLSGTGLLTADMVARIKEVKLAGNPHRLYRPEPCSMKKSLKPFYGKETLGQTMLKDFMPGSRSVELTKLAATVYY